MGGIRSRWLVPLKDDCLVSSPLTTRLGTRGLPYGSLSARGLRTFCSRWNWVLRLVFCVNRPFVTVAGQLSFLLASPYI